MIGYRENTSAEQEKTYAKPEMTFVDLVAALKSEGARFPLLSIDKT